MTTAPEPGFTHAMDLSDFHTVLVVKSGDVDDHAYKRGTRPTVDSATLAKLRDAALIDDAQTQPAG